jgi:hypothetical protein
MKQMSFVVLAFVSVLASEDLSLGGEKSHDTVALTYDEAIRQAPQSNQAEMDRLSDLDQKAHEYRMALETNKLIECSLLSGMAILSLIIVLSFVKKLHVSAPGNGPLSLTDDMLSASGVILIIYATVFLVLVADVNEQLSPSFGILGAIAGYIFGRRTSPRARSERGQEEE